MAFDFIQDGSQMNSLLDVISKTETMALDVESTGIDPYTSELLLIQIRASNKTFILDARKLGRRIITYIMSLVKDRNILVINHNIKFDLKMLYHNTGELIVNVFDTMLAEMMIYNGLKKKFYPSLEDIYSDYMGVVLDKSIRKSFIGHTGEFTQTQLIYSAMDVEHVETIAVQQIAKLNSQGQGKVLELEMKLVPVFAMIEYTGIPFDKERWLKNISKKEEELSNARQKILDYFVKNIDFSRWKNALEIADAFAIPAKSKTLRNSLEQLEGEFALEWFRNNLNLDSYVQLRISLNILGFPVESTSEKALSKYRNHEVIKIILDNYKDSSKKLSTYGVEFLKNINKVTGKIHTDYNQLGTVTGRLSSENPNLQNQPREQMYRKCYVASQGYKLITSDLSQAELRLLGDISREPELIDAFAKNQDPHAKTATFLHNKPIEDITDEERHDGKTLNFAVNYGTTKYGLLYNFGIPLEKGEQYLDSYFSGYKVLKVFSDRVKELIWEKKYTTTPMGRKRFFEDRVLYKDDKDRFTYEYRVKREGFNTIIQGGIADIIKIAMMNIFYKNPFSYDDCRILLQTHDEIVVEVRDKFVDDAKEFIRREMLEAEQPFLKYISAKLDIHVATYWSKKDE